VTQDSGGLDGQLLLLATPVVRLPRSGRSSHGRHILADPAATPELPCRSHQRLPPRALRGPAGPRRPGSYDSRIDTERKTHSHIRQLEVLGHVSLAPAA
jgi:hypothetical protein